LGFKNLNDDNSDVMKRSEGQNELQDHKVGLEIDEIKETSLVNGDLLTEGLEK
jgi:hypothetical protein